MIDFDFENYCTGCSACYSVCPSNAIKMTSNDEGFLIPVVDKDKCIKCNLCDKVCTHLNEKTKDKVFGSWLFVSKNEEAKKKSSSGAAWYEIGKKGIDSNSYLAGCIWDENLRAKHEVDTGYSFLCKTQGSKYVQSDIGDSYKKISRILHKGEKVVFSGTPCQATALHNIIANSSAAKLRDNIMIVGIICHGVSSPLAWESFKTWDEMRHNSKLISVNFRDKSKEGYKKSYCRYEYASGVVDYLPSYLPTSPWMESTIVYNLAMRNSCSHCECKGVNSAIDLILGDWYESNKGFGAMGTSCIVAFTERGKLFAEESLEDLKQIDYEVIVNKNPLIEYSSAKSLRRDEFYSRLKAKDDNYLWDSIDSLYPPKYKLKRILLRIGLYNIVKRIIKNC